MCDMKESEIQKIMRSSIWTNDRSQSIIKFSDESQYISGVTDRTRRQYIDNFLHWNKVFKKIIIEIIGYVNESSNNNQEKIYKSKIKEELSKLEELKFELISKKGTADCLGISNGSRRILQPNYLYIEKGTRLYRYTDDNIHHIYANPKPKNYGRFTVPGDKGTFYLAFNKNVAHEEVAGSNSKKLVKFKVKEDIRALIVPGNLPEFNREDAFFAERLKKFHNLIFSLTPQDKYFSEIDRNKLDKLKKGIYIVTNELLSMVKEPNDDIVVYPSTKVKENSYLGKLQNNKYFVPNEDNADLAIFNDINFNNSSNQFSKYVQLLEN